MEFEAWFSARHPHILLSGAQAVLRLSKEGCTLPFIARYRKEQTNHLKEKDIQAVLEAAEDWKELEERKAYVLGAIEKQSRLSPELKQQILECTDRVDLESLYLPYKKKRKTKADIAREAGLEPLADWIWNCDRGTEHPQPGQTLAVWSLAFHNEEKKILDSAAAIQGAQDILVERISDMHPFRERVRSAFLKSGGVVSSKGKKAKPNSKYETYFDFSESIESLLKPENSHRYLAICRGRIEEELEVKTQGSKEDPDFEEKWVLELEKMVCLDPTSPGADVLKTAARLAWREHIRPGIESQIHRALKAVADEVAVDVFSENLRKLLLAPPLGPQTVLGIDPGIRTGCKLAVVDSTGKYVGSSVLYLNTDEEKAKTKPLLAELVTLGSIQAVAIGNGTAGRETSSFVRQAFKEQGVSIPVVLVSEAGASVYSASEVAQEEFPDLDVTVRGAISIARRLQDPLAELVKVEPKSIGVGQYQHDMPPRLLKRKLDFVVDSCVNLVGVNLNTASTHLLTFVAGLGPQLAMNIVEFRTKNGLFQNRNALQNVPQFGPKAFEQAAGFLRIPNGENPLDNTAIHPERYPILQSFAEKRSMSLQDLLTEKAQKLFSEEGLKSELGEFTFLDIISELKKPGRDPRNTFVPVPYRDDIFDLKDVRPGMICSGIVTNVTNFGAFVDIGVHQDGLVHISQLSQKFVKDPREVVRPGDIVRVKVLDVKADKSQMSFSIKEAREENQRPQRTPIEKRAQMQPKAPSFRPKRPSKPTFSYNPFAALAALKDVGKRK